MAADKTDLGKVVDGTTTMPPTYLIPSQRGSPDVDQSLPSYFDSTASVEDELLPPETLLLADTTIHSTSSTSLPLYQLSHSIGYLRELNTKVELSRFDYRVRKTASAAGSGPEVATRAKHIFNLTRPPMITMPSFEYHLESVSRRNLGHLGLKKSRHFGSSGYRAWRATRPRVGASLEAKEMVFVAKARGQGRYDWRDGADKGSILAYETNDEGIYRLQIVEAMDRSRRDALVGMWCLRLWWEIAVSKKEPRDWKHVKHILQTGAGASYLS